MSKGLIDLMADTIADAIVDRVGEEKLRGRYGEHVIKKELRFTKLFGKSGKILSNLYVPKPGCETTEIDVLYITKKGIFVIECKKRAERRKSVLRMQRFSKVQVYEEHH